MPVYHSAEQAMDILRSNHRVFVHSVAAAPQLLLKAMVQRASSLSGVEVIHLHTEGTADYALPEYEDSFRVNALFVGSNVRKAIQSGHADFTPVFLSEIPALFRNKILPLDVALISVSPPDKHGFCSLGTSVDVTRAAIQSARYVIAQVNSFVPRTHGDSFIHVKHIDMMVEHNEPLPVLDAAPLSDNEKKIGEYVASLVDDGATLQMGIGAIPDAVLASLGNHRELGIHTEMFSDRVIDLVERGVITGEHKKKYKGKIVSGFVFGSQRLYDFVDDNPEIAMLDIGYVNDTSVIRQNPKVTAINSAIEVDITGQVCADSIGCKIYSGVGGQMDFIRGASLSEGGKPIIALPSTTSKGLSRIVNVLKQGAGVVTTRSHVHYIVTEYGIAYLYGKSLRERAERLIAIAHPDHREELAKQTFEMYGWNIS